MPPISSNGAGGSACDRPSDAGQSAGMAGLAALAAGPYAGAKVHDLGGGCSVLTFADPQLKALAEVARAHVLESDLLVFDRTFMLLNRPCVTPRGVAFFSVAQQGGYGYAGVVDADNGMPPCLQAMLDYVNNMHDWPDADKFTGILVNCYRSKQDGIAPHTDKDVHRDEEVGVLAFSLGDERMVQFRPICKRNGALRGADVPSRDGEAMVMHGRGFQTTFKHGINKRAPDGEPAMRMSFTFRRHKARAAGTSSGGVVGRKRSAREAGVDAP